MSGIVTMFETTGCNQESCIMHHIQDHKMPSQLCLALCLVQFCVTDVFKVEIFEFGLSVFNAYFT